MIQIELHRNFVKSFDKRIKPNQKLNKQTEERIKLFQFDSQNKILKDHQLTGNKRGFRSFSVTGDIRIIYYLKSDNLVVFIDIGSHNQVY